MPLNAGFWQRSGWGSDGGRVGALAGGAYVVLRDGFSPSSLRHRGRFGHGSFTLEMKLIGGDLGLLGSSLLVLYECIGKRRSREFVRIHL